MQRKRKYRAVSVKKVDLDSVGQLADGPLTVGMDISKDEVFAVVRDVKGQFLRPWKAKQVTQLQTLLELFSELTKRRDVKFGLESTGTYGDAIRQALTNSGIEVHRVSGKAKSDYEEIFDGVPSAHDGKDAAILAELVWLGKSRPWPYQEPAQAESEMNCHVLWLDAQQDIFQTWLGRIEAMLGRHWPEATTIMNLSSATLLRLLARYGGPANIIQDPETAKHLRQWGGQFLSEKKIVALCTSARTTIGVRMTPEEQLQLQRYADQALQAYQEIKKTKSQLKKMCKENETLQLLAGFLGPATACVLVASLGDPHNYHCAEAYRKAMGLNLKVRSSGKQKGKLKITKRGSSRVRRWLYFAALRLVQQPEVRGWYEAHKRKNKGLGGRAIVAVMRKLALAIWNVVVREAPFDPARLFPGKPLLAMGALPPNPRDLSLSC